MTFRFKLVAEYTYLYLYVALTKDGHCCVSSLAMVVHDHWPLLRMRNIIYFTYAKMPLAVYDH